MTKGPAILQFYELLAIIEAALRDIYRHLAIYWPPLRLPLLALGIDAADGSSTTPLLHEITFKDGTRTCSPPSILNLTSFRLNL